MIYFNAVWLAVDIEFNDSDLVIFSAWHDFWQLFDSSWYIYIYIYIYILQYSIDIDIYIYIFDEFSWLFWCVWMFPQDYSNDMMQHCSIQWLFDRTSWEFSLNTIYDYLCVLQSHVCSHVQYIYMWLHVYVYSRI